MFEVIFLMQEVLTLIAQKFIVLNLNDALFERLLEFFPALGHLKDGGAHLRIEVILYLTVSSKIRHKKNY